MTKKYFKLTLFMTIMGLLLSLAVPMKAPVVLAEEISTDEEAVPEENLTPEERAQREEDKIRSFTKTLPSDFIAKILDEIMPEESSMESSEANVHFELSERFKEENPELAFLADLKAKIEALIGEDAKKFRTNLSLENSTVPEAKLSANFYMDEKSSLLGLPGLLDKPLSIPSSFMESIKQSMMSSSNPEEYKKELIEAFKELDKAYENLLHEAKWAELNPHEEISVDEVSEVMYDAYYRLRGDKVKPALIQFLNDIRDIEFFREALGKTPKGSDLSLGISMEDGTPLDEELEENGVDVKEDAYNLDILVDTLIKRLEKRDEEGLTATIITFTNQQGEWRGGSIEVFSKEPDKPKRNYFYSMVNFVEDNPGKTGRFGSCSTVHLNDDDGKDNAFIACVKGEKGDIFNGDSYFYIIDKDELPFRIDTSYKGVDLKNTKKAFIGEMDTTITVEKKEDLLGEEIGDEDSQVEGEALDTNETLDSNEENNEEKVNDDNLEKVRFLIKGTKEGEDNMVDVVIFDKDNAPYLTIKTQVSPVKNAKIEELPISDVINLDNEESANDLLNDSDFFTKFLDKLSLISGEKPGELEKLDE